MPLCADAFGSLGICAAGSGVGISEVAARSAQSDPEQVLFPTENLWAIEWSHCGRLKVACAKLRNSEWLASSECRELECHA